MLKTLWRTCSLLIIAVGFAGTPVSEAHATETTKPFVEIYNDEMNSLHDALMEKPLQPADVNWVRRQHRALRLRAEIALNRSHFSSAALDMVLKDLRALTQAVHALNSPEQTTQNTH